MPAGIPRRPFGSPSVVGRRLLCCRDPETLVGFLAMAAPSHRPTRIAPATPENIAAAAATLRAGGLVAMPTETVYGLAALATSDSAAAAIFAAKRRPSFNPLIAHFADAASAAREADLDPRAARLAAAFWPGPLTIVGPGLGVLPDQPARAGGAGYGRPARALPQDRARADRGRWRAARRAVREPVGTGQPDARRTCRRRPARARRLDSRRWPLPARAGVDDRRLPRRDHLFVAPRRDFARSHRGRSGRGDPRGGSHRGARADRARAAGFALCAARTASPRREVRRRGRGGARLRRRPRGCGGGAARLVRLGRSRGGGGAAFRPSARARRHRRRRDRRGRRSRSAASAPRSTTGCAAPPRRVPPNCSEGDGRRPNLRKAEQRSLRRPLRRRARARARFSPETGGVGFFVSIFLSDKHNTC